jgi:hypothetical protein
MASTPRPSPQRLRPAPAVSDDEADVLSRVLEVLRRVRFGTVSLVVHEGKVVQIETAEKFRLP